MPREEILERLVALHDERVEEEKRGIVRWLQPEYQIPRCAANATSSAVPSTTQLALAGDEANSENAEVATTPGSAASIRPWPSTAVEQLAAVTALVSQHAVTVDEAVAAFEGGVRAKVERHLETLEMMGEVAVDAQGRYGVMARSA